MNISAIKTKLKIFLIKSHFAPSLFLTIFSKDSDPSLKREIAENSKTPTHILEILSNDEHYFPRNGCASNPKTPIYLLKKLAKDEVSFVREAVAENLNTPESILIELASDSDFRVRKSVENNPNIPESLSEVLSLKNSKLKKEADELAQKCINTCDSKEIKSIIRSHLICISEPCEICDYIINEDQTSNLPILLLASNEMMTAAQHEKCYIACFEWQGLCSDYIENLVQNKNLNIKTKKLILEHIEFSGQVSFADSFLPTLLFHAANNPSYTASELVELCQEYKDWYGLSDDELINMIQNTITETGSDSAIFALKLFKEMNRVN